MPNFFKKIHKLLLDLIFPIECLNCRREGAYLCEKCFRKIKFNGDGDLERLSINLKIPNIQKIFIAGNYEDSLLRSLIKKYKYGFILPLGEILARFLINFWNFSKPTLLAPIPNWPFNQSSNQIQNTILVVPIPLSRKRLLWRGFNQAEIIAREFSAHFNYSLDLRLKRTKHQPPQADLDEATRLENIKSAFSWTGLELKDEIIILIDDVTTTGATLNEAAGVLKSAGAKNIWALVLAKG